MFENVIFYKCKCNNKIHRIVCGQNKTMQQVKDFSKMKCDICGSVIVIQKKERWATINKKITKEIIS